MDVDDLFGSVNMFDLDSEIQVYWIKQPVWLHTVGSGDVSRGWTSATYDNLDHSIIVFKDDKRRPLAGTVRVWRNVVYAICQPLVRHERFRLLVFGVVQRISPCQRLPSSLRTASNEIISVSVLLCDTAVFFTIKCRVCRCVRKNSISRFVSKLSTILKLFPILHL